MSIIHKTTRRALPAILLFLISQNAVEAQSTLSKVNVRESESLPQSAEKTTHDPAQTNATKRIVEYEDLLKKHPNDAMLHNNLGTQYALQKRFDEAAASIEESIRLNPKLGQVHVNLAIVYNALKRYDDALASTEAALQLSPDHTKAKNVLCDLYTFKELHREAISCYVALKKELKLDKVSTANYGYALLAAGEAGRAAEVLGAAVDESPNDVSLLNGLGMAQYRKKKYESCVATFKRALEISPERSEVRFNLALAQMANRDRAAALRQYNFLKNSDPDLAKKVYRMLYRDKLIFVDDLKR